MAALTLTLTLVPAIAAHGDAATDETIATTVPPPHAVQLDLAIAGLVKGGKGCDVEIKPGHGGCKFRPVAQHVGFDGRPESSSRTSFPKVPIVTLRSPSRFVNRVRRNARSSRFATPSDSRRDRSISTLLSQFPITHRPESDRGGVRKR